MQSKLFSAAILLYFVFSQCNFAQKTDLYIPLNILKAYNDGTRSFNGVPGPNYWENYADYSINASLNPLSRMIVGNEKIYYTNNSPDTLKALVIRLYQDIFRKGNYRDFPIDSSDLTNGMNIKSLFINGDSINLSPLLHQTFRFGTNLYVILPKPVLPKTKTEISCDWSFVISLKSNIRMGTIDSSSYYVGYWYPQISVYDDIDGWDRYDYTGLQEFYNNFGDFNVNITVPKNFVVWATGILQNPAELLSPNILAKMNEAERSDSVIHIITKNDLLNGNITLNNSYNIWKFKASNVSDFAFAVSDHFLWDGGSVITDKQSGNRTFVNAAYSQSAKDFPQVTDIAMKSIEYFSNEIPGIPFPYPKMTVVNGSNRGGMEYPMMVNDYSAPNLVRTVGVTSHEIAHTYFPFFMGTNERKYAWMDEGWATALPVDLQNKLAPEDDQRQSIAKQYELNAGSEMEEPMMVSSELLKSESYTVASYYRPAEAYLFLRDMLGDETFLKALHEYLNRWNGKHPIPYDFFFTFNDASGQNLDWFWKPWFFESGYPDLGIKSVQSEDNTVNIIVEKIGNIPIPVKLKVVYKDGTVDSLYKSAFVWRNGDKDLPLTFNSNKPVLRVELGSRQIPDVNPSNNIYLPK